jgi:hypothetical protein
MEPILTSDGRRSRFCARPQTGSWALGALAAALGLYGCGSGAEASAGKDVQEGQLSADYAVGVPCDQSLPKPTPYWSLQLSGEMYAWSPSNMAAAADGSVYYGGSFRSPTFTINGEVYAKNTSKNESDVFVVKVGPGGEVEWTRTVAGPQDEFLYHIGCDEDNGVILAGKLEPTEFHGGTYDPAPVDLGGGPLGCEQCDCEADLCQAGFLLKLDKNGSHVWSRVFNGSQWMGPSSTAAAGNGDLWVVGAFHPPELTLDGLTFDSGLAACADEYNCSSSMVLLKLGADGNVLDGHAWPVAGKEYNQALTADGHGGVLLTGWYFFGGPDLGTVKPLPLDDGPGCENFFDQVCGDGFLARINQDFEVEWVLSVSGDLADGFGSPVLTSSGGVAVGVASTSAEAKLPCDLGISKCESPGACTRGGVLSVTIDGECEWLAPGGGLKTGVSPYMLWPEKSGYLLVTGAFAGPKLNLGCGDLLNVSADPAESDAVMWEMTPDGDTTWAVALGGSGRDGAKGLARMPDGTIRWVIQFDSELLTIPGIGEVANSYPGERDLIALALRQ